MYHCDFYMANQPHNEKFHNICFLLTTFFKHKQLSEADAKQKAEGIMKKISTHFKQYVENDPAFNYEYKSQIIQELVTQNDPYEKKLLVDIRLKMNEIEQHAEEAMIWVNNFNNQSLEFNVFNEAANTAGSLDAMRDKMHFVRGKLELIYSFGRFVDAPEFIRINFIGAHQLGLALDVINVMTEQTGALPQHITLALTKQALRRVAEIGATAVTSNWMGLGIALLDVVEPFLDSQTLRPLIVEKAWNFVLSTALRHRFNDSYTGHTLDEVDDMFHRINRIFNLIIEDSID